MSAAAHCRRARFIGTSLYYNVNNFFSEGLKMIYDFRQNPRKYLTITFQLALILDNSHLQKFARHAVENVVQGHPVQIPGDFPRVNGLWNRSISTGATLLGFGNVLDY